MVGNDYYYCWISDVTLGQTLTMRGMGSNYRGDGSNPTASLKFELNDCYVLSGSSRYGVYTHCSNGNTRMFGSQRWNGMGGGYYTKSVARKINNNYPIYVHSQDEGKNLYYDTSYGKWTVGKINSANGWWESASQPSPNSSIELTFKKPQNSTITGQDYSLSFVGYVAGDEKTQAWTGEVAKWL